MKLSDRREVTTKQRQRARALRISQTDAERRLWHALRYRLPKTGSHFRRQVSIGPYIVDFCSHGAKLVVEVDGNQHGTDDAQRYDRRRTAVIEAEGYRVLRFSNAEVMLAIQSVIDTIFAALAEAGSVSE